MTASAEPARVQRLRADALLTPDTTPDKPRPQPDVAADTVPPATTAAPAPSEVTYCMAKLESLKSLFAAIASRRQQVSDDLGREDIAGAQMAYDVMRWATEDLQGIGQTLVERCNGAAPDVAVEAQSAVSMTHALWQAAESDCRAHFARVGLDCG